MEITRGLTQYFTQSHRQLRVKAANKNRIQVSTTIPSDAEVVVFEEDTRLSLTPEEQLYFPEVSNVSLTADLMHNISFPVGSVVRNGDSWNAVIHNLELSKTLRPENVAQTWVVIFNMIQKNNIKNIGVALLGTVWGRIPIQQAVRLFLAAQRSHCVSDDVKITVIVPEESFDIVSRELSKQGKRQ